MSSSQTIRDRVSTVAMKSKYEARGWCRIRVHVQDEDGNPLEGIRIVVTTLEN